MYVRSRKPAAGIASASASRYETSSVMYINTESARYGTTEVAMSNRLRPRRGRAYGARVSRQEGRSVSVPGIELGAAPLAIAASLVLLAEFSPASASTEYAWFARSNASPKRLAVSTLSLDISP